MRRRTVIIAAGWWLGIGVIVSLAVACALAYAQVAPRGQTSFSASQDDEIRSATVARGFGVVRVTLSRAVGLNWAPGRAIGSPDTPRMGDIASAWASLTPDGQAEWLDLVYAQPVDAALARVYETYSPGALVRVTVIDPSGRETTAWTGTDPAKPNAAGVYVADVPLATTGAISHIRLHLDSVKVSGWNEIDAVALVDHSGKEHWASRASASSTYASRSGTPNSASPTTSFAEFETKLPRWCRAMARRWGAQNASMATASDVVEAHGWPLVAAWSRLTPAAQGEVALPARPIWSGLLIDGAIWGSVLAGLYASTRGARRCVREGRRLRRGCCMRCGYDLRFDLARGCPECGWRREAAG